jgi:hypothetical protein
MIQKQRPALSAAATIISQAPHGVIAGLHHLMFDGGVRHSTLRCRAACIAET